MSFRLISPEDEQIEQKPEDVSLPERPQNEPSIKYHEFIEKTLSPLAGEVTENILEPAAHAAVSAGSEVASTLAGFPGDMFSLANKFIASPITSLATNEKGLPYEETTMSKIFPTSNEFREFIKKSLPYTEPRNDFEKFINDVAGTTALTLTPGGQAKIGLIEKMQNGLFKVFFQPQKIPFK